MKYELYHSGILGMKWGIRRYQNKDGSLTAAGRKRYKNANVNAKKAKRNGSNKIDLSKMTDEDLKKAINRMALEKEYKKAARENSANPERVRQWIAVASGAIAVYGSIIGVALAIKKLVD